MIIIIGIFGIISALALFIVAIMLFTAGEVWLGIGLLLSVIYIVALTVLLIRLDGNMTDKENRISKLEAQIEKLIKHVGLPEEAEKADDEEVTEKEPEDFAPTPAEAMEGISFCKKCGYQLFPEDNKCPNCGTEINSENSSF